MALRNASFTRQVFRSWRSWLNFAQLICALIGGNGYGCGVSLAIAIRSVAPEWGLRRFEETLNAALRARVRLLLELLPERRQLRAQVGDLLAELLRKFLQGGDPIAGWRCR